MLEFHEKTALITGAAGNLGRATALAFADAGAQLVLVDRNQDGLREVAAALPEGARLECIPTDLIDPDSVAAMRDRALAAFGAVDVLANIAGGFRMGPLLQDTPEPDWDFMMDLNARSVFHCCRALLPGMVERGAGRIVNISARAAVMPKGRMGPYCASKAAVKTLTESLALENKTTGVTVNCILPGTIDTPQNRADMPDADFSTWVPPEAIADVIVFLASDAARCVTGAAIPVYGKS